MRRVVGKYKVCFTNRLRVLQRAGESMTMTVRFIHEEPETVPSEGKPRSVSRVGKNATKDEHLVHLSGYSDILSNKAKELGKYQSYEITKEGEFKDTIESTNSIIQWCAIAQTVVFCVLGCWQIWSLRRFFIKRGIA